MFFYFFCNIKCCPYLTNLPAYNFRRRKSEVMWHYAHQAPKMTWNDTSRQKSINVRQSLFLVIQIEGNWSMMIVLHTRTQYPPSCFADRIWSPTSGLCNWIFDSQILQKAKKMWLNHSTFCILKILYHSFWQIRESTKLKKAARHILHTQFSRLVGTLLIGANLGLLCAKYSKYSEKKVHGRYFICLSKNPNKK